MRTSMVDGALVRTTASKRYHIGMELQHNRRSCEKERQTRREESDNCIPLIKEDVCFSQVTRGSRRRVRRIIIIVRSSRLSVEGKCWKQQPRSCQRELVVGVGSENEFRFHREDNCEDNHRDDNNDDASFFSVDGFIDLAKQRREGKGQTSQSMHEYFVTTSRRHGEEGNGTS
eukprot:scaffold10860_cov182-Amphora_coffeaeformis.AAC.23